MLVSEMVVRREYMVERMCRQNPFHQASLKKFLSMTLVLMKMINDLLIVRLKSIYIGILMRKFKILL